MKLETEWKLGLLAAIGNMLSVFFGFVIAAITVSLDKPELVHPLLWLALSVLYVITLTFLIHIWADKFNYMED